MIQKIKLLLAGLLVASSMVVALQGVAPATSYAQVFQGAKDEACKGTDFGGTNACNTEQGSRINQILRAGLNVFSVLIGVAAVVMIIVGGFRFVASGGDANAVSSAKKTIVYAVVGLIVVALAQFIVFFVLDTTNKAINPPKEEPKTLIIKNLV